MPETKPDRIVLYDIAMAPPRAQNTCSPNPWKARLALNFKNLSYETIWVPLPSIPKVRKSLKVPACRTFMDGTDYYTLPMIEDPSTGRLVGDSFDIALYLQQSYPEGGDLFPDLELEYKSDQDPPALVPLTDCRGKGCEAYAAFNLNVDAAFTAHVGLCTFGFPWDPATAEETKAEFVRRASVAGVTSWEQFKLDGEAREKLLQSFEKTLGGLAALFRKTPGPFVGEKASYADIIVDAWLQCFAVALPPSEWERVRSWHDGTFGKLFDAMAPYQAVDEGHDFVED